MGIAEIRTSLAGLHGLAGGEGSLDFCTAAKVLQHLIEQQDVIKSLLLTNDSMETTSEQIQQQLKEYLGIQ